MSAKESSGELVVRDCYLALEVSKLLFSSTDGATTEDFAEPIVEEEHNNGSILLVEEVVRLGALFLDVVVRVVVTVEDKISEGIPGSGIVVIELPVTLYL